MSERKTGIELLRFFAAATVVIGHAWESLYPDKGVAGIVCIVVDFFFMLSGYFAMRDAAEKTSPTLPAACDSIQYIWHKAKKLFGIYVFALVLMFVIRTAQKDTFCLSDTLKELFHFKWEFLMIHMMGFNHAPEFNVDYLLGPVWFISAMMIALVPFYFLGRRFGKSFSGVIAPICSMLIYAYIVQTYDTIDVGNQFVLGTMLGNLRAFAGLSAGAFVFHIDEWIKASPETGKGRAFLRKADAVSWILALALVVIPKGVIPDVDGLFWLIPLAVLLLNGVNDIGPVTRWLNHRAEGVCAWLGKLSLYLYLFHVQIIYLWKQNISIKSPMLGGLLIFAVTIAVSALIMTVREKIDGARRKRELPAG